MTIVALIVYLNTPVIAADYPLPDEDPNAGEPDSLSAVETAPAEAAESAGAEGPVEAVDVGA